MLDSAANLPGKEEWATEWKICLADGDRIGGFCFKGTPDENGKVKMVYGLQKEHRHKGIITESCRSALEKIRKTDVSYITATHDINNPRSGRVMRNLGMTYRYSCVEQWQPKDTRKIAAAR